MKRLVFLFLISAFVYSCQNDPKPGEGNPSSSISSDNPYAPDVSKLGPKPAPLSAPDLTGRMQYVVDKYWWFEGYVSSRDQVVVERRGRWYYYLPDGTFVYGKFQTEEGWGTWRYDNNIETLYNRTENGIETMQWKTMMSHTNDKFIWMGPPVGPNKGDQGMLQPYIQKPNPEDIHWVIPKVETAPAPPGGQE